MATMTMKVTLGEAQLARLGVWRSQIGYPPEKSNDSFVRDMFLYGLEMAVPDVKKE
jgi:hypothetical protein